MRIFAYIGSLRGKHSNTYKLAKKILDKVSENTKVNIEYEIITASDIKIERCCGCTNCFTEGYCKLDEIDGFGEIKDKLVKADMIVFGSPVYATTVTGDMKIFLDRLSYWLHLFKLAGKPGVSIVTASANSVMETSSYLKKIMQILGIQLICNVICTVDIPKMIDSVHFNKETLPRYIETIKEYTDGDKIVKSTDFHEKYFQHFKDLYTVPDGVDGAEIKYWRESGYLDFQNYGQLLEHLSTNKK